MAHDAPAPACHSVADLFPMLPTEELFEHADDIKEHGLLQPVVLDGQGRVLDGRNRLAACRMDGVEPRFPTYAYAGADPAGYALSVNLRRRMLTKGQKVMIAAKARRVLSTRASVRDTASTADMSFAFVARALAFSRSR